MKGTSQWKAFVQGLARRSLCCTEPQGIRVTVKLTIQNRAAKVDVEPNATSLVIKAVSPRSIKSGRARTLRWKALKEPLRDRKKTKNIKHSTPPTDFRSDGTADFFHLRRKPDQGRPAAELVWCVSVSFALPRTCSWTFADRCDTRVWPRIAVKSRRVIVSASRCSAHSRAGNQVISYHNV